jgi:hypothetical protein
MLWSAERGHEPGRDSGVNCARKVAWHMAAASMQRGRGRWFIRAKALGHLLDGEVSIAATMAHEQRASYLCERANESTERRQPAHTVQLSICHETTFG